MAEGDNENGAVLKKLAEKIDNLLKKEDLSEKKEDLSAVIRSLLEVQQLFVIYMMNDHPKTQTMWRTYRPAMWAFAIVAASFLGLLATGRVSIIIR